MTERCDLLLRGGRIVDAAHDRDEIGDVAIRDGRVLRVGSDLNVAAARVLDVRGCYVLPGLIDLHVHVSSEFNGHVAQKMLARAGVTTALDLAGPVEDVLQQVSRYGAGLNVACINRLKPGERIAHANPSLEEIRRAIDAALREGAIGVKILGGHFPLTPEATARVIEEANRRGVYVAYHCRTTASGSDLTGLREAIELAGPHRLHVPHINSFCRGSVRDPVDEALEAIEILRGAPHLFSESYLAAINGTWGRCRDGVPESDQTKAGLIQGGYPPTEDGLRQAILDGHAKVHVTVGDEAVLASGREGVAYWEAAGTNTGVSFEVNPPLPRLLLYLSKDSRGRFDVDALATDGGGIPRNNMVSAGLALVEMGMLTAREFVAKASWVPARVLGLRNKGHLGEGADADIAVVEAGSRRVRTTICGGAIVMHEGLVFGRGTRFITTAAGAAAVAASGCEPVVIDLSESGFYTGEGLKA